MMVQIRRAAPKDAGRLATIITLAMADVLAYLLGDNDEEKSLQFLTYLIAQPDNQYSYQNIWVAEVDGDILGQVCLYDGADLIRLRRPVLTFIEKEYQHNPVVHDETTAGEIYLDTIAVASHAQGMGIGKLLLQYVVDFYVVQQKATVGLLVDRDNKTAKSLYLRTGFSKESEKSLFGKRFDHLQIKPESSDV